MVDSIQAEIDANRRMVSIISGKPGKDCYNDEELCELASGSALQPASAARVAAVRRAAVEFAISTLHPRAPTARPAERDAMARDDDDDDDDRRWYARLVPIVDESARVKHVDRAALTKTAGEASRRPGAAASATTSSMMFNNSTRGDGPRVDISYCSQSR